MVDNKRTFITCEIPSELLEEIDGYAIRYHVKRSDIIRQALYEFCEFYSSEEDNRLFEYHKKGVANQWRKGTR